MIPESTLLKAQSLTITPIKNKNPPHYALIFSQVPYRTKNCELLYSEIIFPDCTFTTPILDSNNKPIKNTKYIIPNLQSYLYKHKLSFTIHDNPTSTLVSFTLQLKEE